MTFSGPAPRREATAAETGPATLVLARHGETVWHHDNRYAGGDSDIDLTARGHRQAQALARWAVGRRPRAVISSPVRRAQETAAPAARAMGLDLVTVQELREVDFGFAEGRTIDELDRIDSAMVSRFRADPQAHPFPGSEQPQAAATRAASALRVIATRHPNGTVLVVAHNTALRLALCELLGLPVAHYRDVFPRLRNAAITEIVISPDPRRPSALLSLNVPLDEPDHL